ncbi:MAG TPA: polysaccharide biosynthesis/export family protein [Acidobacteriota bacterium]|jgi:polysaccharide export outer membrane protein
MTRDLISSLRSSIASIFILLILWPANLVGEQGDKVLDAPPYIIQSNDILEIFVWKEPELSRKVLVRPDGRISFPLVQDLIAAGTTPGELKQRIETRLKEYITAPNVTVIVDTIQHYKVYVIGKVQKPGSFTAEKPISALQALTLAGGFQDYAKESEITIVRTNGKEHVIFRFDYKDVIKGKKPDDNILLDPGDVVVVP